MAVFEKQGTTSPTPIDACPRVLSPKMQHQSPRPTVSSTHPRLCSPWQRAAKGKQPSPNRTLGFNLIITTISNAPKTDTSRYLGSKLTRPLIERDSPHKFTMATSAKPSKEKKDTSKVHKLSLKGSAKLVAEFVRVVPSSVLLHLSLSPFRQQKSNDRAPTHFPRPSSMLTKIFPPPRSFSTRFTRSSTSAACTRPRTSPS